MTRHREVTKVVIIQSRSKQDHESGRIMMTVTKDLGMKFCRRRLRNITGRVALARDNSDVHVRSCLAASCHVATHIAFFREDVATASRLEV